jgi:3-hydroxyisobutyrate dehydrogenase-like beta-hydroxyacid dehydrogenase
MLPAVGWIGVGNIGAPMAQRVAAAGYPLRVWARNKSAADPLVARGAAWRASPEALAAECELLVTIVGGPADVLEVHERLLRAVRTDIVVLEMSTASPATAAALQKLAAPTHAQILDCPVTGGVAGAREGKLTSFVGGDAGALARCRPLLETFCRRIVHCGGPGSGYRMKLVNQTMIAGILLGLANGSSLARDSGFDVSLVEEALAEGTASGVLFRSYLARMMQPPGEVTFTLGMLRKDLALARDEMLLRVADPRFVDFALGEVDRACARFGERAGVQQLAELGR